MRKICTLHGIVQILVYFESQSSPHMGRMIEFHNINIKWVFFSTLSEQLAQSISDNHPKYSPGSVRLTDGRLTDYFIGEHFTTSFPILPLKSVLTTYGGTVYLFEIVG